MSRFAVSAVILAAGMGIACGKSAAKAAADKAAVTAALQNEAAAMKRDGEKLDPSLGVKATWTIHKVEVTDQPGNESQPYAGVVVFRINSRTDEPTGPVESNFEKTFKYAYDAKLNKWLFKP